MTTNDTNTLSKIDIVIIINNYVGNYNGPDDWFGEPSDKAYETLYRMMYNTVEDMVNIDE